MDHFRQIPQVGRGLGRLARELHDAGLPRRLHRARPARRARHRRDLSQRRPPRQDRRHPRRAQRRAGGLRARAGWFEREHRAYGWPFPPPAERYALLEDALQLLPLHVGPGQPRVRGPDRCASPRRSATRGRCRSTCRSSSAVGRAPNPAARGAVRRRRATSSATPPPSAARSRCCTHCAERPRPDRHRVTHLSRAVVVGRARPGQCTGRGHAPRAAIPETFAASVNAATVDDHVGRFRQLAEAGVQTAIVNLPDLDGPGRSSTSPRSSPRSPSPRGGVSGGVGRWFSTWAWAWCAAPVRRWARPWPRLRPAVHRGPPWNKRRVPSFTSVTRATTTTS